MIHGQLKWNKDMWCCIVGVCASSKIRVVSMFRKWRMKIWSIRLKKALLIIRKLITHYNNACMKISKCSLEVNCGNFGWLSSSFDKFEVKSLQKGYTKCRTMRSLIILNKNLMKLMLVPSANELDLGVFQRLVRLGLPFCDLKIKK
jgi:hypothetical protein